MSAKNSSATQSFDLKDKYERCSTQALDPNIELKKSPIEQKEEQTEIEEKSVAKLPKPGKFNF